MKPYKLGDRITNWDRYRLCPTCGQQLAQQCRCQKADAKCPNGHEWHNENGIVTAGAADHSR